MKSKHVLIIHSTVFFGFVAGSLASPILNSYYPRFFSSGFYLPLAALLMISVIWSWKLFGGCPFTVWENRLRHKEDQSTVYSGPCLPYYATKWFGLSLPPVFYTSGLVLLLLLPVTIGIIRKF